MMRHSLYRSIVVMYIMQPCWWFMRLHVNVRVCANFSAKFRFIPAFHGFHLTWIVASIGSLSTLSERRTIAAYMADAFAYYRNAMFRWQIDGSTTAPRSCYDVHTDIGYGQYNIFLCFAANIAKFRAKKTKKKLFYIKFADNRFVAVMFLLLHPDVLRSIHAHTSSCLAICFVPIYTIYLFGIDEK